jgi:hypothetical protein
MVLACSTPIDCISFFNVRLTMDDFFRSVFACDHDRARDNTYCTTCFDFFEAVSLIFRHGFDDRVSLSRRRPTIGLSPV